MIYRSIWHFMIQSCRHIGRRLLKTGLAITLAVLFAALAPRFSAASQNGDPVIAAAGDIACDPNDPAFHNGNGTANGCAELRISQQLSTDSTVDHVLSLGDIQYYCDALSGFSLSYDPTWGQFNSTNHPVVGNHEYITGTDPDGGTCPSTNTTAANYFAYFGAEANPDNNSGWYSYDLGGWHLIALNANCGSVGGCGMSSAETKWLKNDLNSTNQACILAYWHQPLWTGITGNNSSVSTWWTLLYQKHADVILNGHVHNYQRFPKLNPSGQPDPLGVREVIARPAASRSRPFHHRQYRSLRSPSRGSAISGWCFTRAVMMPPS